MASPVSQVFNRALEAFGYMGMFTIAGPAIGWIAAFPVILFWAVAVPGGVLGVVLYPMMVFGAYALGAWPAALTGLVYALMPKRQRHPTGAAAFGAFIASIGGAIYFWAKPNEWGFYLAMIAAFAWCGAWAGFFCAKIVRWDEPADPITPPTPAPPPPSPQTTP